MMGMGNRSRASKQDFTEEIGSFLKQERGHKNQLPDSVLEQVSLRPRNLANLVPPVWKLLICQGLIWLVNLNESVGILID